MDDEILEPLREYATSLREKHKAVTEEYFDELVKKSGVDADANAETVAKYKEVMSKLNDANKYVKKFKNIRLALIFCIIALGIVGIATFQLFSGTIKWLSIFLPIVCGLGAIALIVVICVVINKRIKAGSSQADDLKQDANRLEQEAWAQLYPLNSLYDWNIPGEIISKAVPQIQIDKYFDLEKFKYFETNFALSGEVDDCRSVYCVRTGNSGGNPFLIVRYLTQDWVQQRYDGSLTVSWTETVRNSDGSVDVVTKSETLRASVYKPKPDYSFSTRLYYGNDAAPDLRFTREPVVPAGADDKKIQSIVKKGEKQLEKKTREAVKKGTQYNKLANSEFEVLFGADDRTNEMQFRMLFTPLAQQNEVKIIKNNVYGDDFSFYKFGKINVIRSVHGASLDIDANPTNFLRFDLQAAREFFINYNVNYFKSVYFDFAPLLAIPLYQQEEPQQKYEYCGKRNGLAEWELESLANFYNHDLLTDPETAVGAIIKTKIIQSGENGATAVITGHSFRAYERVDYVSVRCSNGNYYDVAVPWIEYLPVQKMTQMSVNSTEMTRKDFIDSDEGSDSVIFVNGLKASLQ